ncbi:MAG: hypothetical protein ACRDHL_05965 [Candidatus Promineifilaceae bacterium]
MTRLWPEGQSITVVSRCEEPCTFTWHGHLHQVEAITQRWRIDLDWWRERAWRAYFKLYTDTGLLVVIYRDLLSGQWYLQRLYD